MYHIYHTEAFVLGSNAHEEGSRRLRLFTQELGLIHALAQGIREEKSKLRYSLESYSHTHVSLIHGKTWRIVFAHTPWNFMHQFGPISPKSDLVARIFSLIRKLVVGEEKNTELFLILKNGFEFLKRDLTSQETDALEHLIVLKVLKNLGYVASSKNLDEASSNPVFDMEKVSYISQVQNKVQEAINHGLVQSQLLSKKSHVL